MMLRLLYRAVLKHIVVLYRFLLRSGNPEHPGDKFFNTSIQVLSTSRSGQAGGSPENNNRNESYRITQDGFYVIDRFDDDSGLASGSVPAWLGPIDVLRLYVETTGASWVILSEVRCFEVYFLFCC